MELAWNQLGSRRPSAPPAPPPPPPAPPPPPRAAPSGPQRPARPAPRRTPAAPPAARRIRVRRDCGRSRSRDGAGTGSPLPGRRRRGCGRGRRSASRASSRVGREQVRSIFEPSGRQPALCRHGASKFLTRGGRAAPPRWPPATRRRRRVGAAGTRRGGRRGPRPVVAARPASESLVRVTCPSHLSPVSSPISGPKATSILRGSTMLQSASDL